MRGWPAFIALAVIVSGCLNAVDDTRDPGEEPAERHDLDEIEALLTKPVFERIVREQTFVSGADDAQIWVDVYRPEDAPDPVPTILVKTPYQGLNGLNVIGPCAPAPDVPDCLETALACAGHGEGACPYSAWLVSYYGARGYAVAFSDVRGNYNSGGCIDQSGPKQWQDGYNVVQWLAEQSWSNGKVGMYGASYDGETQISTALLNPPALKTIVPTASVSNQYEYSFYDGVPYSTGALGTSAAYLAISLVPGPDPNAVLTYHERFQCQLEVFGAALDQSGDWSQYWEDRDYRIDAAGIQASVLQTHGLQDWNVKPNHVDGFFNELTSEKRLVIGQWGHNYPQRDDWTLILHRWFDHYLHGNDTGILDDLPPVLVEDTERRWHGIQDFPPTDAGPFTLWPHADGSLAAEADADGHLTIQDHPRQAGASPLPLIGDLLEDTTGNPSRLVFQSEPLTAELHYTGRPVVHLSATSDAERTRWAVHLVDVSPEGDGQIINRGYFNTRHIDGLDDPGTIPPGTPYQLSVRMFPQSDVIPAGHSLRLVVTNADNWIQQDTTYATSQIHLGPEGTHLVLPLAPPGDPIPADALREELLPPDEE